MGTCWPTWIRASRLSETRMCGAARSLAFDLVAMAEIIARTSPLGSMPVKVNPALFAVVAVSLLWMHLSIRQMERPSVSAVTA